MVKTNIENCNEVILDKQKEQLFYEIVNGENAGRFSVFDIEAGCRKTRTAEAALVEAWKRGRKSIFVRRTDDDCRESMKNINEQARTSIAFAYNNEDVPLKDMNRVNKRIPEIPVIIITHQKYMALMKDTGKRKLFAEGRVNLVIDEFLSTIHTISLGAADIDTYRALLRNDMVLLGEFEKTMYRLIDFLTTWNREDCDRRFTTFSDTCVSKKFNALIQLIKANMTNDILKRWIQNIRLSGCAGINMALLDSFTSVKAICDQLMQYKELITSMCLYNDRKLYTTDKRYKYWFLENNVMLDASGELQIAYSLNQEEFELRHCEKVLDHSRWKILNIPVTTTTAAKERMLNFYEVVNHELKKYDEDILVVGKKDEMQLISVPEENKGYFGNITGSNLWYDKKHVAIIQTHNLSDVDYILKYLHYSQSAIDEALSLSLKTRSTGRSDKRLYSFTDQRLERVRVHWIASEIYQAVKRVNRNMEFATDVLIFINNEEVINLLHDQMKNISVEIVEYDYNRFKMKNTRQDDYIAELKQQSHATRFIDLLSELQNGVHAEMLDEKKRLSKIAAREYLGINNSSNFSDKVLRKSEVITYCQARNIRISRLYIEFE